MSTWHAPELQLALAAIDEAWTNEQVHLLRSWAAKHGDAQHRENAVAALDEHLNDTHKLSSNDFLRVAYLLNGGLLLDETEPPTPAESSLDEDFASLMRSVEE
jgi:hypothetical protein